LQKFFTVLCLSVVISGCFNTTTRYRPEPQIQTTNWLKQHANMIAIKVTKPENISVEHLKNQEGTLNIAPPTDLAKTIQEQLQSHYKEQGFKIIGKPLLADLAYEIEIEKFDITLHPGLLTTIVKLDITLMVTVRKHSKMLQNRYKGGYEQEMVNPVTTEDLSPWVNQKLGELLSKILAKQDLSKIKE